MLKIKNLQKNERLFVFVVNCDWRDIFRINQVEFQDKIKRDHLGWDKNRFFYLSFSQVSYDKSFDNLSTKHINVGPKIIKPLIDLISIFFVPWTIFKKKLRPDIWLAYDFGFLPSLWLARLFFGGQIVMVLTNQPRIYSRTRKFGRVKAIYSSLLEKFFHNLPDYYMTINQTMKSYLEKLNVPAKKIFIFYTDTISRDQSFIDQARKGIIRKKLKLSSTNKILLSVGRLETEKDYHNLIKLFSTLSSEYVLIILGQGSLLDSLQRLAKDLNIDERVFFEGFVDREQIWNYYLDADVFILLSKAEALGMVFWEAMYLNVPVIGSIAPGIIETIGSDLDRGRLWQETEKEEGFKAKVLFCIQSSYAKSEMLERAKTFVTKQISNNVTLNNVIM